MTTATGNVSFGRASLHGVHFLPYPFSPPGGGTRRGLFFDRSPSPCPLLPPSKWGRVRGRKLLLPSRQGAPGEGKLVWFLPQEEFKFPARGREMSMTFSRGEGKLVWSYCRRGNGYNPPARKGEVTFYEVVKNEEKCGMKTLTQPSGDSIEERGRR
jgi:hypothetical protein